MHFCKAIFPNKHWKKLCQRIWYQQKHCSFSALSSCLRQHN